MKSFDFTSHEHLIKPPCDIPMKIAAKLTIGQLLQRDRSWHDESAGGIRGHGINLDCRNQSQNELSSFLYKCSDMM